jgi:integrase
MGAAGEFSGKLIDSADCEVRASHLPDFITLTLYTGCRKRELLGLEWQRVNLQKRVIFLEGLHAKSSRRRSIPLNRAAYEALRQRKVQIPGGALPGKPMGIAP